jgi:hypothetical protein
MNILIKIILLFNYNSIFTISYSKDITHDLQKRFSPLFEELETYKDYAYIQTVMYSYTPVISTLFKEFHNQKWNDLYSTGLLKNHAILLKEYSEDPINVKVFLQDHSAPILYFLPGTLRSNEKPISLDNMKYYYELGFHVVSFSNPWTSDMLSKRLKNKMGDLESEAKLHWALIEELEDHIIPQNIITQRKLLGKSYGALLGPVILDLSYKSGRTLDELILISPPDSLLTGTIAVDNLINNYRNFNLNPLIMAQMLSRNTHKDFMLNPETTNNAKASIAQFVFLNNLSDKTAADLKNVTPIGRDKVNIKNFMEKYYPESLKVMMSKKGSLDYWLNQLRKDNLLNRVKLIMSENDPLSTPGYAQNVLKNFPEITGAALPGGGHNLFDNRLFDKIQRHIIELLL